MPACFSFFVFITQTVQLFNAATLSRRSSSTLPGYLHCFFLHCTRAYISILQSIIETKVVLLFLELCDITMYLLTQYMIRLRFSVKDLCISLSTGRGRYILLVFDCMLVVGIYFCADMPSALLPQIQGMQVNS